MACVTTGGGRGISTGVRKYQTTRETARRWESDELTSTDSIVGRTTGHRAASGRHGVLASAGESTVSDTDPSREERYTLALPPKRKSAHSPQSVETGSDKELIGALLAVP